MQHSGKPLGDYNLTFTPRQGVQHGLNVVGVSSDNSGQDIMSQQGENQLSQRRSQGDLSKLDNDSSLFEIIMFACRLLILL